MAANPLPPATRETARQIAEQIADAIYTRNPTASGLDIAETIEPLLGAVFAAQVQDIHAYRGALGYSVPGEFGERLLDGTRPSNGIAEALQRQLSEAQDREARLRELLAQAKPRHYAGECWHCGLDELPPDSCPMLKFIADIDAALAEPRP
jgi:hypothetical protein